MRALIQRVKHASVTVEGNCIGKIEKGLLVLLGVGPQDTEKQADFLAEKCANLRIFVDENDKMNLSLLDIGGEMLVVSQFTLYADCKHGRRPSFIGAAAPAEADRLYEYFQQKVKDAGVQNVQHGEFGADMKVELLMMVQLPSCWIPMRSCRKNRLGREQKRNESGNYPRRIAWNQLLCQLG